MRSACAALAAASGIVALGLPGAGRAREAAGRTPGLDVPAAIQSARADASADGPLEALLRLHHAHRVAHVTGDAAALAATFDDPLIDIGAGRAARRSRAEAMARFEAYFAASTFLEWEDVRPPVVQMSADGTLAAVHVEKRVRLIAHRSGGPPAESAERFAWTEIWHLDDGRWLLHATTSTRAAGSDPFSAPPAQRLEAARVLRAARTAMGGEHEVALVAMVAYRAECEGPRGSFRTRVVSARDGRVRFEQEFPDRPGFSAGIDLDGGWQTAPDGVRRDSLGREMRSVVYAHEMLLLALGPEARYRAPYAAGTAEFHGRRAAIVRFADLLDAPADFYYDLESGLPLGFGLRNHTGRGAEGIETRFSDWRQVGPVRLPFAVTIVQGEDVYRYRLTEVDTGWVRAAGFEPS